MPNSIPYYGAGGGQFSPYRPGTTDPNYQRRQALAQQLVGKSVQPRPAYSWGEALANALTPVVQTWGAKDDQNKAQERDTKFTSDYGAVIKDWEQQGADPKMLASMLSTHTNRDLAALAPDQVMRGVEYAREQAMKNEDRQWRASQADTDRAIQQRQFEQNLALHRQQVAQAGAGSWSQPQQMMVDGKPVLVQFNSKGGHRVVEGLQPPPEPQAPAFAGSGLNNQALSIVVAGQHDPKLYGSTQYAAAWNEAFGPKKVYNQETGVVTIINPPVPPGFKPPPGIMPQEGQQPPPAPQAGGPPPPPRGPDVMPTPQLGVTPPGAPSFDQGTGGFGLTPAMAPPPPPSVAPSTTMGGSPIGAPPAPPVASPGQLGGLAQATPPGPPQSSGGVTQIQATPRMPSGGDVSKLRSIEAEAIPLQSALAEFTKLVKETPTADFLSAAGPVPTPAGARLNAAWANVALMAKNDALYNLGVLNGKDLEVLRNILIDPSTIKGAFSNRDAYIGQVDQVNKLLNDRVNGARRAYLGEPGKAFQGSAPGESPPAQQQAPQPRTSTEQPSLPPQALSALKEGANTTFKNGQVWTLRGGKPERVR